MTCVKCRPGRDGGTVTRSCASLSRVSHAATDSLRFGRSAGRLTLDTEQRLRAPLAEVFAFFADAKNLEALTPSFMHFEIRTPSPIDMQQGTLIDYRIKLRGLPLRWRTRISAWEPPHRFVDEQLRGPYLEWKHEHRFETIADATLVFDHVKYRVLGGRAVDRLLVRPDLRRIFDFRRSELARRFGAL
jgi:ligand-binding SRPBCC domain-containing protein